jgi:hypothetical protein
MAEQYAGLEVAEALFKEIIAKGLYSYVNRAAKFYGRIEEGEAMETNSRGVRIVAEVEANPSNRSFAEGGKYAPFSFPRDINMRVFWTRHSKGRGYSRDEYEALMSSQTSIVTGLTRDIKRETGDLIKVINFMSWNNGSGVVARVDSAGSPVVTGTNGTAKFAYDGGSYHILVRGRYNFINPATGLARLNGGSTAYVSTAVSKTSSTQTVTFDVVPSDAAAGDYLVYEDSYLSALHGVPYHVNNDTGAYQGQSRALYENLRSVVIDAAVASVAQPLSTALLDRMEAQTAPMRPPPWRSASPACCRSGRTSAPPLPHRLAVQAAPSSGAPRQRAQRHRPEGAGHQLRHRPRPRRTLPHHPAADRRGSRPPGTARRLGLTLPNAY